MSMMVRTGTLHRNRNRRNSRASSVRQTNRKLSLAVPSGPGAGLSVSAPNSPRNSITSLSPRASLNNTPRHSLSTTPNRSPSASPRGSVTDQQQQQKQNSGRERRKSRTSSKGSVTIVTIVLPEEEISKMHRNVSLRKSLRSSLAPSDGDNDRRRSSSSVSIAVDDTKKLYSNKGEEKNAVKSYGSIVYQFRDGPGESAGTLDFLRRSVKVISTTVFVTVLLISFMVLPLMMIVIGIQYLRDCPKEPNIPIYLLVGGCFGLIKIISLLWRQTRSRRYEQVDTSIIQDGEVMDEMAYSTSTRGTEHAISVFLFSWFVLGNYWVYNIWMPRFEPQLRQPNDWCSKTVYVFAFIQICICYTILITAFGTLIFLLLWNYVRNIRQGKV
ncbi:Uncharacterised protein g6677 [Pycnogonum litorale]